MDTTTTARLDNDGRDADTPPTLPFVHMWTGLDGKSRLDESVMRGFGLQSVGGGADPQWMRPFPGRCRRCCSRRSRWGGWGNGIRRLILSG